MEACELENYPNSCCGTSSHTFCFGQLLGTVVRRDRDRILFSSLSYLCLFYIWFWQILDFVWHLQLFEFVSVHNLRFVDCTLTVSVILSILDVSFFFFKCGKVCATANILFQTLYDFFSKVVGCLRQAFI